MRSMEKTMLIHAKTIIHTYIQYIHASIFMNHYIQKCKKFMHAVCTCAHAPRTISTFLNTNIHIICTNTTFHNKMATI